MEKNLNSSWLKPSKSIIILNVKSDSTFNWIDLTEEELLEKKISDLKLEIQGSELESQIQELYQN